MYEKIAILSKWKKMLTKK